MGPPSRLALTCSLGPAASAACDHSPCYCHIDAHSAGAGTRHARCIHLWLQVSHDRFFLDRIATHILAAEGDANWVWFEGNYAEYEEDYLARNGDVAWKPVKYAANTLVSV